VTQGGHISTEPRINERIRVPEVRLVGPAGEQVGIVAINDALALAQEADLDLVEVAPTARPPVCKLMDYGKFKYESALKARESRKNQTQTVVKEIKLRPKIDPHDYGTKKGHVERFLKQGDKVKVTIMFRGREQSRPELGHRLLQRLAADVQELGFVEAQPKLDGRNMIMVIGPHKKKADQKVDRSPGRPTPRPGARESAAAQQSTVADEVATAQESMAADEVAAAPVAPAPVTAPPAPVAPAPAAARPAPAPAPAARPAPVAPAPAPAAARPAPAPARPATPAARPAPAAPVPSAPARRPVPTPRAPRPAAAATADRGGAGKTGG
jgi:translation initiation factor IF-3